jgi:hypothetical protein
METLSIGDAERRHGPVLGRRRRRRRRHGRAVQVEPIKPTSKAPGIKRLKPQHEKLLSKFAFNFNLRHYSMDRDAAAGVRDRLRDARFAAQDDAPGRAVQLDPIKPNLKPPGTKRLKLNHMNLLSSFAFNFNLRRYILASCIRSSGSTAPCPTPCPLPTLR